MMNRSRCGGAEELEAGGAHQRAGHPTENGCDSPAPRKSCGLGVVHDSERHQPDSRSGDTQNGLHADQPVASMIQLAVSEIQR